MTHISWEQRTRTPGDFTIMPSDGDPVHVHTVYFHGEPVARLDQDVPAGVTLSITSLLDNNPYRIHFVGAYLDSPGLRDAVIRHLLPKV